MRRFSSAACGIFAFGPLERTFIITVLILPTEGVRIHALQVDIDSFKYAETEEEKEKVLQELLNNPNNKIVEMTPTEEPSKGGSTEAVDEGE